MYKVMWWNAAGEAQISEAMRKETAVVFLGSMHPSQEAHLVYVTR